ncbi:hypothetical protein PRK78_002951 [Emydomyces testavorans]|uniref:Uncharacterized protein n=1 Tax=Emydomyces testavorans TaxID=2070801 RepID=A0AAF0DG20_9EURO|nr:hypothetical protein PRK78_002951 [Emydomyces testavorans]
MSDRLSDSNVEFGQKDDTQRQFRYYADYLGSPEQQEHDLRGIGSRFASPTQRNQLSAVPHGQRGTITPGLLLQGLSHHRHQQHSQKEIPLSANRSYSNDRSNIDGCFRATLVDTEAQAHTSRSHHYNCDSKHPICRYANQLPSDEPWTHLYVAGKGTDEERTVQKRKL